MAKCCGMPVMACASNKWRQPSQLQWVTAGPNDLRGSTTEHGAVPLRFQARAGSRGLTCDSTAKLRCLICPQRVLCTNLCGQAERGGSSRLDCGKHFSQDDVLDDAQ